MMLSHEHNTPDRLSLAYGIETAHEVNNLALAFVADSSRETSGAESKLDKSIITDLDKQIHELERQRYPGEDVVLQSEEGETTDTPAGTPNAHADPQDGSNNFEKAYKAWVAGGKIGPFVCGSMFSQGIIRAIGEDTSRQPEVEQGIIVASYFPSGPRIYSTGKGAEPSWEDSKGNRHILAPSTLTAEKALWTAKNEAGKMVVILSENSAKRYGPQLIDAGLGVEIYDAAVTSGLSAFDRTVFEELKPGVLKGRIIVATIMHGGKNWDVAGLHAMANKLNGKVTKLDGTNRTYRKGETGAIVAQDGAHGLILGSLALR